ncbi:MAG: hypothetical protein M0D54_10860 [Hyphomonadaceae bacterium JAD_PAG50586_4]|nr:MAG: hypothetical protein M0D54_10860 [Hyphomonadaceae bacterium JAD_PAG50586_4]
MAKAKKTRKTASAVVPAGTIVRLTVLAQDPSLLASKTSVITTTVDVPAEKLGPGPHGHRIRVVDYDATADCFYGAAPRPGLVDRYSGVTSLKNSSAIRTSTSRMSMRSRPTH